MKINCLIHQTHSRNNQKQPTTLSQLKKTESVLFQQNISNAIFRKVFVPADSLNKQLEIYEWRSQIHKGIVRCKWTCILPVDKNKVLVETKRKLYPFNLKDLSKISLTQILYILKDSLEGFQVLYKKFGSFQVCEECISFDEKFQIEVWLSKQASENKLTKNQLNQHEFVCSILQLFAAHEIKSNVGNQFHLGLMRYECLSFDILRGYIEHFIARKQLIIANQKSMKQILSSPKSIKNICEQNERSLQKVCSLKSIQSSSKQQSELNNESKQFGFMFSPTKKSQKKRISIITPSSAKVLKQSDMTLFTDRLQMSQQMNSIQNEGQRCDYSVYYQQLKKKSQNLNYQSLLSERSKNIKHNKFMENVDKQFSPQQIYPELRLDLNFHRKNSHRNQRKNSCQILYDRNLENQTPAAQRCQTNIQIYKQVQNLFTNTREVLTETTEGECSIIEDQIEDSEVSLNSKDLFQQKKINFQSSTNDSTSVYKCQENYRFTNKCQQNNDKIFGMSLTTHQTLQNPDLAFEQNKSNLLQFLQHNFGNNATYFQSLQQIAQSKQMTSSIQIGKQIQKISNSPLKLQRLGKFRLITHQSIIYDEYFQGTLNQSDAKFTQNAHFFDLKNIKLSKFIG